MVEYFEPFPLCQPFSLITNRILKDSNPVSYRWKRKDNGKHYGLIAQELLEVYREHGLDDRSDIAALDWDPESDRYGLRYSELISPMIKAIQELSAKVDRLERGSH